MCIYINIRDSESVVGDSESVVGITTSVTPSYISFRGATHVVAMVSGDTEKNLTEQSQ